jgi:hypothetical protein
MQGFPADPCFSLRLFTSAGWPSPPQERALGPNALDPGGPSSSVVAQFGFNGTYFYAAVSWGF